jgi:hypothetical protein
MFTRDTTVSDWMGTCATECNVAATALHRARNLPLLGEEALKLAQYAQTEIQEAHEEIAEIIRRLEAGETR